MRGSGKTVQLLRLKQDLQRRGFAVVMFSAEDYLNMHEPLNVVDVLFFLVGAISDQAVEYDLIERGDSATSRGWSRLWQWLSELPSRTHLTGVEVSTTLLTTTASLKAELRRDTAFVAQLREFLWGRLSELVEQANLIVGDLVDDMRRRWCNGEWKGLVVIVDSLDHNRAVDSEKFQQVRRALVNLFDKDYDNLRLTECRTVFTLPMYVPISAARAVRRITNLRVTDRDRKPNTDGLAAAREVLLRRAPDGELNRLLDDEWLAAWRTFLLAMNHRRDILRARLGGLVIAAPPAVKVVAQRESPDLWSVRDLLVKLAARPVATRRAEVPCSDVEPHQLGSSRGLSYESGDAGLAEEAQVLLAMPAAELAGPCRERVSRAVHRAAERGEDQLAAVLLLAQSDGYRAAGDPAGALHLVQEGLTLEHVESRTRERLLNSGVDLASALSELELAQRYAAESVALTEQRVSPEDPEVLRDLSYSLNRLGDATHDLGDPATATTHYQQALDIAQRLADQLDTPQALRDLTWSLNDLGDLTNEFGDPATAAIHYQQALDIARRLTQQLGNADAAATLRAELDTVSDQLAALSDDSPDPPPDRS